MKIMFNVILWAHSSDKHCVIVLLLIKIQSIIYLGTINSRMVIIQRRTKKDRLRKNYSIGHGPTITVLRVYFQEILKLPILDCETGCYTDATSRCH